MTTPVRSLTFTPADGVPTPCAPFAHATLFNDLVFVTGQMPVDPATNELVPGGIVEQTDQVLTNLNRVLELSGSSLKAALQIRAYLLDFDDYDTFNRTYLRWFPDRLPSRTCVGVNGLALGALVELDVVAHCNNRFVVG